MFDEGSSQGVRMATCPSCQQKVSVLFYSLRPSVLLGNMVRSPAGRVFTCRNCGAQLTMTTFSFILCQVAFIVIVIPCAIGFARLETWLVRSVPWCQQLAAESPNRTAVALWIAPTLLVTLFLFSQVAGLFVEFEKAES